MRIIKLFKNHILALFVAIGLIVISCNADLALPSFMSEIVDVGIQQSGIEHAATDAMSAETFDALCMLGNDEDEATPNKLRTHTARRIKTACEPTSAPKRIVQKKANSRAS